MDKIKNITLFFLVLGVNFLASSSFAAISTGAQSYKTEYRYNNARQVTGTISPYSDGGYIAVRNSYTKNLLTKVESGHLSSWRDRSIAPSSWGGYFIIKTVTTFTYDDWGRKLTERLYDNNSSVYTTKQYSYNDNGKLVCEAIRMNPIYMHNLPSSACSLGTQGEYGKDRITRYNYDSKGRVSEIHKAWGTSLSQRYVAYTYKGNSQLKETITDANGNLTRMSYDSLGRLKYWYFPSKTTTGTYSTSDYEAYDYDDNGNRTYHRKRDNQRIYYSYDELNRVKLKNLPSGYQDVHYRYDNRGLQTRARFGSINGLGLTNTYNGFGEIIIADTSVDGTTRRLQYQYDQNGNRTRITHIDNAYFIYTYDGLNRTKSIRENGHTSLATGYYNTYGALEKISRGSGSSTEFDFDGIMRLQNFKQNLSGSTYDTEYDFDYNPAGQVVRRGVGNDRYHHLGNDNIEGTYQVNGLNQYTSAGGKSIQYDGNGNLTSFDSVTYNYDVENRLTSVSGAKSATLKYDPMGRLYEYSSGGTTRRFIYDGDKLIAETNTSGTIQRRYVHGNGTDRPLVEYTSRYVNSSYRRYLFADYQGSIIASTNSSGGSPIINTYDAFGIPDDGNTGRFGYTGQMYLKELGLYHYKARVYNPKLGRFMQTDPIGYEDQMNLYGYVYNDPNNFSDPTGMSGECSRHSNCYVLSEPDFRSVNTEKQFVADMLTNGDSSDAAFETFMANVAKEYAILTAELALLETGGYLGVKLFGKLFGDSVKRGADITANTIKQTLKNDSVMASQKSVDVKLVQKYYNDLDKTRAPYIKMDGDVIVDGHHRYIAGKIKGQMPGVDSGVLTEAKKANIRPISNIETY